MRKAEVTFIGFVRSIVGVRTEVVEFEEGATVRGLIAALGEKHGDEFKQYVLDEQFRLSNLARLLVGGTELGELPEGYDTVIEDGCEIAIMTIAPLSGG